MNKNQIRERILNLRISQSVETAEVKSKIISEKLLGSPQYKNAESIMVYFPIKGEVLTDSIVANALKSGKILLAPKMAGDDLIPVRFNSSSLFTKAKFGVTEPQGEAYGGNIDIVIVPAVAFDQSLNRLGYGKGYYDKFLKDKKCIKIGIGYGFQVLDYIPKSEHDIPMDILIHD
jgi:5-formyltetrahydrofolate cyclo-ligase